MVTLNQFTVHNFVAIYIFNLIPLILYVCIYSLQVASMFLSFDFMQLAESLLHIIYETYFIGEYV